MCSCQQHWDVARCAVVNGIVTLAGVQRHPEPGLHGGAGLRHRAEDTALPAESGGADGLGGAESPHPCPPVRQTCTQGGGHRWAGRCSHCNDSDDDNNGHWACLSWDSLRCLHLFLQ